MHVAALAGLRQARAQMGVTRGAGRGRRRASLINECAHNEWLSEKAFKIHGPMKRRGAE
jgi:hypothetical protein